MSEPMTSPGDKQPPKEWWLENACCVAAFRLRQQRYMSANTVPNPRTGEGLRRVRPHRLGRDRTASRGRVAMMKAAGGNRLSSLPLFKLRRSSRQQ